MTIQIQSTGSTASVAGLGLRPPAGKTAAQAPLLPEPCEGGLGGTQDALSMMYGLVAEQGQVTMQIGETSIANETRTQEVELDQEKQAETAQTKAEANQGGFWSDIFSIAEDVAKIAGVVVATVASVAASVASFGSATGIAVVAVAAVLLSSGAIVSATHCLGKDSEYIGMGMEVAGALVTMGAAAGAASSTALTDAAQVLTTTAQITQGTATILTGVSTLEIGKFQSETEDDAADIQQVLNLMNHQSCMVNELVSSLKSSQKSNQNALALVAGTAQTYGQTLATAASGGRA